MPNYNLSQDQLVPSVSDQRLYTGVLEKFLQSCNFESKALLAGHIRGRNFKALLDWSDRPSPQMYGSAASYFAENQMSALIKKYPFSTSEIDGIDPEGVALAKFRSAEHRCKRYNLRARLRRTARISERTRLYDLARQYIVRAIGVKPEMPDILSKCDFTAGASYGVHGNKTNLARKFFAREWTCTPSALPYAMSALWLNIHARHCVLPGAIKCYDPDLFRDIVKSKVRRVDCNKIVFVPKTAKTHRSIAVEPLLNGYVQKGVDLHLREKLRRVGIDLSSQLPNQLLARAGSTGGINPFCTIDLSSASDSLATEVVRDLLPPEWFEFLSDIRSPRYAIGDEVRKYDKFCSMGNGFCFPLQTLIFASVCHAVATTVNGAPNYDFSVYGDDIIVRQNVALLVIEILRDIGFRINTEKTFITGSFRESCGSDWYDGQDVRPVHFDKRLTDIRQVFAFHNSTLRSRVTEDLFTEVRSYLRSVVGARYQRPGREPGDTCYSVPLDTFMASKQGSWRRDTFNWQWREVLTPVAVDKLECLGYDEHANALMYAALRGANSQAPFTVRFAQRARTAVVSRPWSDDFPRFPSTIVSDVVCARKTSWAFNRSRVFYRAEFDTFG